MADYRGAAVPFDERRSLGWTPPRGGGQAMQIVSRDVPEQSPPPGAVYFAPSTQGAIVGVGATLGGLAAQVVLAGYLAVVRRLEVFVSPFSSSTDVRFALRVNGLAAPGMGDLRLFAIGGLAVQTRSFDLALPVPVGSTVDVLALDVDGAAYTVGASLFGWQWDSTQDARLRGGV